MTPPEFAATYRSTADQVSAGTGIDPIALLAQWANETEWGTAWAGAPCNLGNIRNGPGGSIVTYSSLEVFAEACIATFHNGYYGAVLAAQNATDQLAAIVASPWSAGHYGGSLQGFYGPLEGFELTPEQSAQLARIEAAIGVAPGSTLATGEQNILNAVVAVEKAVAAIPGAGGTVDLTPVLTAIANLQTAVLDRLSTLTLKAA